MDRIILMLVLNRQKDERNVYGCREEREERGGTSWSCIVTECSGDILT
jgi:hypothetical protein